MKEEERSVSATSREPTPSRKIVGVMIYARFPCNLALISEQRTAVQMNNPRVEITTNRF